MSEPVRTLADLKRRQAEAAVAISGADHSSWNGREGVVDPAAGHSGKATWDGTIEYKDDRVNEPLREMLRQAGHYNQPPEDLRTYRRAVQTMLHENSHLLAQRGARHADGMQAYQTEANKALEEGVTDAWTLDHLDDYIDELGLDRVAPGIKDVAQDRPAYPQYVPAARQFAASLGRRTGLSGDEVLRRMNNQTVNTKFETAAAMLHDASPLARLETGRQRDESIRRIADAMRPHFAGLHEVPKDDRLRRQSAVAGAQAERAGSSMVASIVRERTGAGPQAERDTTRGAEHRTGPGGPATPEMADAMRIGLGGSPALASARRLDGGEFGSRRGPGTGGVEQGPRIER